MLLVARLYPFGEDSRAVLQRILPGGLSHPTSNRYPVKVDDKILPRILQQADSASGYGISAEARFTRKELQSFTHFEVICRKVIPESPQDYQHNAALYERTSLIPAGGEAPIRLAHGFALTRIKSKPNMVGAIGDWTEEYVIGSAVVQVFERAAFTGWSVQPVFNSRTQLPHPDFFHIFGGAISAVATIDCSVERIRSDQPEEDGQLRHLGCLSYPAAALENNPDFTRTAEPWGGWHGQPSWVVSSCVAKAFAEHKLRGWAFRPVLVTETNLYRHYLERWQVLHQAVAQSLRSKFEGGRW